MKKIHALFEYELYREHVIFRMNKSNIRSMTVFRFKDSYGLKRQFDRLTEGFCIEYLVMHLLNSMQVKKLNVAEKSVNKIARGKYFFTNSFPAHQ
jgi:hypothetical protein